MQQIGKLTLLLGLLAQSGALLLYLLGPQLPAQSGFRAFLGEWSQVPLVLGAGPALVGGFLMGLARQAGGTHSPKPATPTVTKASRGCPQCGKPLVEGDAFCASCGSPATPPRPTLCSNTACRKPLREGVRFCPSCGTPVP